MSNLKSINRRSIRFNKNNKIKKKWLLSKCRSFYTLSSFLCFFYFGVLIESFFFCSMNSYGLNFMESVEFHWCLSYF